MVINLGSFLKIKNKHSKISDFQDLEHLDGVAISVVNAKLYNPPRDDVVLFCLYTIKYCFRKYKVE